MWNAGGVCGVQVWCGVVYWWCVVCGGQVQTCAGVSVGPNFSRGIARAVMNLRVPSKIVWTAGHSQGAAVVSDQPKNWVGGGGRAFGAFLGILANGSDHAPCPENPQPKLEPNRHHSSGF